MKGLLIKDYYVIKDTIFIQLITLSVVGFSMAFLSSAEVFITMAITCFSLFTSTAITADKTSKWNIFSSTIPVSKINTISSKYWLNNILILLGVLLGLVITTIILLVGGEFVFSELTPYILLGLYVSFSSSSINIPLAFVLNEKQQIIAMFLSVGFSTCLFAGTSYLASFFTDLQSIKLNIVYILLALSLVSYTVSWIISPKIIAKLDIK